MKKYKLSDITLNLIDGKHGGCDEQKNSGYYFVSVKDLKFNYIDYSNAKQISKEDFDEVNRRTKLEMGDTIYANSGDTIGKSLFIDENSINVDKTTFQKSVAILKPNTKFVIPKYLFYLLKYETPRLRKSSSGSAQKNLLLETMRNFEVTIHDLDMQNKIMNILNPIDTLIAHKIKMNLEIETFLQNSFIYKIVNNNSTKWETIYLKDYLNFEKGIEVPSINNPENIEKYVRFYKVGDMDEELDNKKGEYIELSNRENNSVTPNDVVVSFDGTPGKVSIGLDGCYSSGIRKIKSINNQIPNCLIYLLFKSKTIQYTINQYSTGSNILHAGEAINHLKFKYNYEVYKSFGETYDELFKLFVNNITEIKSLIKLRDELIPLIFSNCIKL